jgi:hypothetical protein
VRVEIDPSAAMFLHYPEDTSSDVVSVAVLEGDVEPDVVRTALPLLQSAWPLLNVHPEKVGRRWWYTTDGTPGIDLELIDREDDETWRRAATEIVNRPATVGRGPLLRVALVRRPGGTRVELLVVMHHLIVDGVAPSVVIGELLALIDGLAAGDDVPAPAPHPLGRPLNVLVEERFSRSARARALTRYLARSAGAQRQRTARLRRCPPRDADALSPTGSSGHGIRVLEPEVTPRLRAVARAQGTTLTGALYGAAALAMRDERYGSSEAAFPMTSMVTINLRRYFDPPVPDDVLGVYVGSVLVRTPVSTDSSVWDVARAWRSDLDAVMARQLHLAATPGQARIAAHVLPRGISTTADIALSSTGTSDLPTGYRTFTCREFVGVLQAKMTAGDVMVSGGTLDGRFPITFDYSTKFLSDAMATRIADRTAAMLEECADAA